ncbi:peptidylprolyl isomerase [Pleurocapsa sp. CCALA 161]|uniref:peptidylprolyl isomerase n=1 Tax=Pleurocapsa sp. CCALA 161 TaxID=2107688 RepID=UPI000D063E71|nr:peptidylprolyl isomerase [Pleurocapsa sp. CCALA 161]PSB09136.1 peptidylprolyl isomerase [Pleurocapsa sp. CCALA 161]
MSEKIAISPEEIIQQIKFSRLMPEVTKEIASRKIISDTATAENVVLSELEIQQAADSFRLQNNLFSTQATLNWLEKYSLSIEEFEQLIYYNCLCLKLAQHLYGDRVEAYFYEHQLDYTEAIIHEIVLADFDLGMELFYGIQEQEFSFWDVAHQYIQEPELRYSGGYRGCLKRSQLKPEISMAVFAANPPQVLKPIVVNKQTYLIFVSQITQPKLDSKMRYLIASDLFNQWLQEQVKQLL